MDRRTGSGLLSNPGIFLAGHLAEQTGLSAYALLSAKVCPGVAAGDGKGVKKLSRGLKAFIKVKGGNSYNWTSLLGIASVYRYAKTPINNLGLYPFALRTTSVDTIELAPSPTL